MGSLNANCRICFRYDHNCVDSTIKLSLFGLEKRYESVIFKSRLMWSPMEEGDISLVDNSTAKVAKSDISLKKEKSKLDDEKS